MNITPENCNYCNEQRKKEIKDIKEQEKLLSERLVLENQILGKKLAETKHIIKMALRELKAIEKTEAIKSLIELLEAK